MEKPSLVHIDGAYGEGGGQVLRSTAALAALLGVPISVTNIRKNRDKPGLRAQHLAGLQFICDLCDGDLQDAKVGSTAIIFRPGKIKGGSFTVDPGTAGSTGLLLQIALPCIIFAPKNVELTLKGGTNASMAPPIDFLLEVFQPMAKRFGINIDLHLHMRGFYPKGNGIVKVKTMPHKELSAVKLLERGELSSVQVAAFNSGRVPDHVPQRMIKCVMDEINATNGSLSSLVSTTAIKEGRDKAFGDGTGIIIIGKTSKDCILAGTAVGQIGRTAEKVGQEAAELFLRNVAHGGCVDEYLQDQIIILMALAKGKSAVLMGPLTLHTTTNIHFCELMTGAKFTVTPQGERNLVECEGIAYSICS